MHRLSVSALKAILFCMAFAVASVPPAMAQEFSIQSDALQETREIVVHLPENYDPGREEGYPVIYMLDAKPKFSLTAEIANYYYWGDLIPELIVIGLGDVGGIDLLPPHFNREIGGQQVPGKGRELLAYIENELIPFADSHFNTNGNNVAAGHSWGGQYLTYVMSQSPGLFDAYFITSPAFGDSGEWSDKTFESLEQTLGQDQDFPELIYLSMGGDGYPGPLTDAHLLPEYYRLTALLRRHLPQEVRFMHEVHDSANHTSNGAISMTKALQLYFGANPETESGGVASIAPANAQENTDRAPEATEAEAELSFRDTAILESAFIDISPAAREGTVPVGELAAGSASTDSIVQLAEEIGEGQHGRYDSLLIAHEGKLVFESYYARGRINLAHPQASATKAYTSLALGRAIELGYLTMADLDKPLIDFLPDVDRTNLAQGAERLTLHMALTMQGGLSISDEKWEELQENPAQLQGQGLVQTLLEHTGPITAESQTYLYGNFNPIMVMAVIDAVVPGTAQDFLKTEILDQLGVTNYTWQDHVSGLPQAGWMVSITSRDMLKLGSVVLNDGQWNGEQFVSAEYLARATSGLVKPTQDWMPETYRYGYFWYQTPIAVDDKSYSAAFAWGGGGQRIIVVDELDLVIAITGHDGDDQIMDQISNIILPAFAE